MCFNGVAISAFKSLKCLSWVTGLKLALNFEVLEIGKLYLTPYLINEPYTPFNK